jgi:hypothetical protein
MTRFFAAAGEAGYRVCASINDYVQEGVALAAA